MTVNKISRLKQSAIGTGFRLFGSTGAHKLAARWTGGLGAILMYHRVRPWQETDFAPNRLLEITPEFLAQSIDTLRDDGFEIVSIDEAIVRLNGDNGDRRFAVLSFDDGYRDNLEYALPVLREKQSPFVLYVTPGFADRNAPLWWVELEQAVRHSSKIEVTITGKDFALSCESGAEKSDSFNSLYWFVRALPEHEMLQCIRQMAEMAGVNCQALTAEACMDWEQLAEFAREPLCTIGAHTMTHPMLAKLDETTMRREIAESRDTVEKKLGVCPAHFAYPVGDPSSAGPREFAAVAELGFRSGVTTRPGMLFSDHGDHLSALPRLSVNGNWQDRKALEVLLSGAPFALWNRGRRVVAG